MFRISILSIFVACCLNKVNGLCACPPLNTDVANGGRCGPQFGEVRCNKNLKDYAVYCNSENGWCGNTNAHRDAQAEDKYDWQPTSCDYDKEVCPPLNTDATNEGRCGPLFGGVRCNKNLVDYAVYCNSQNGWCGNTNAHRDAQAEDKYDFEPTSCAENCGSEPESLDCCAKRCRKPWSGLDAAGRNLYIQGFKTLADNGVIQQMSKSHGDLFNAVTNGIHWNPRFLPWHRAYTYDLENKIRALGGEYACFALPYWDWSDEPTPTEVSNGESGPVILNSGLGNDPRGQCITDGSPFSQGSYDPESGSCLRRDVRYDTSPSSCFFTNPASLMDVIDNSNQHGTFTNSLEGTPHYNPHVCISGNMAGINSPDDPIFYLHHNFVDYIYAVWQDCNNYDQVTATSNSAQYAGNVDDVLLLPHNSNPQQYQVKDVLNIADLNIIYEKGPFWTNANVDDEQNCGVGLGENNINSEWFYDSTSTSTSRRRRLTASQEYRQQIYDELVASGQYPNHKQLVHIWGIRVCEWEQQQAGGICQIPDWFDDCSDMAINGETNDIDITLDELLAKQGLNECMKERRREYYPFAVASHSLRFLCAGCFDPFCDKTILQGKCNQLTTERNAPPPINFDNEPKFEQFTKHITIYNISESTGIIICILIILLLMVNIMLWLDCDYCQSKRKRYSRVKVVDSSENESEIKKLNV